MERFKIIVSHPGTQHSRQVALAFQEVGFLTKYFTSISYKKELFPYNLVNLIPSGLKNRVLGNLQKRHFDFLDYTLVCQNPWYEFSAFILRKILNNPTRNQELTFWVDRRFDSWVAKCLRNMEFDIFIGYEDASLESFKVCKERGKKCILDLAASHWLYKEKIIREESSSKIFEINLNSNTYKKLKTRKNEEIKLADSILVPSTYLRITLVCGGVNEDKISLVPYGVDLKKFSLKEEYNQNKKFKLLYVGGISPLKGVSYLLEAHRLIGIKDIELILIGGLNYRSILKTKEGVVKHINYVPNNNLTTYYQNADVFILPSLDDGFGLVVLEAMACGTPVIVSENTGAKDVVRNGINGFVIPARSVEAIKDKILFFYNNRDKVKEMGLNARKQAEQYSWENYRENIRKVVLEYK